MAVTIWGLTIGDDGTGFVVPTYAQIRDALAVRLRQLRGIANLVTAPGSFFGNLIDDVVTGVDVAVQSSQVAVERTIFTQMQDVALDQFLADYLVRVQASPTTVVAYAYGTAGSVVGAGTSLRTSTLGVAFNTDGGVAIPAAPTVAYAFELTPFADGVYVGSFFFVNVAGNAYPYPVGPLDTGETVRNGLVDLVNAALGTQVAYRGGVSPTTGRYAGMVIERQGAGPFAFSVSGPAGQIFQFPAVASPATAQVSGPVQCSAESLRYGPPLVGVQGYTNPEDGVVGRERETDSQFRARHQIAQRGLGGGSPDAVRAIILSPVEVGGGGASYCGVEYNPTDVVDGVGNVPHSLRVIVNVQAKAADVALALWKAKAAGDNMNGAQVEIIQDAVGNDQTVLFDYLADVWVGVNIVITPGPDWPITGQPAAQVSEDVAAFIEGLSAGADVMVNELPISFFPDGTPRGVANFTVDMGVGPGPGGPFVYQPTYPTVEPDALLASILVGGREKARCVETDVSVTLV